MRRHISHILSLLAATLVLGFAGPVFAAVDSYTLGVNGMACPFCAYGVEKKLKAVDGVESLDIRIKDDEVDVTVADEGTVTPSELQKAIKEAGFAIRDITVTGTAELKKADGSVRAVFSEDFALPVDGYDGKSGEFEVRGKIVEKGDGWRLVDLETGG